MKTLPLHPANQMDSALQSLIESTSARVGAELRSEIGVIVVDEIAKLGSHIVERPLDTKAAAAYLSISPVTLRAWISAATLPPNVVHRTTSGTYFFFPSELRDFIKSL